MAIDLVELVDGTWLLGMSQLIQRMGTTSPAGRGHREFTSRAGALRYALSTIEQRASRRAADSHSSQVARRQAKRQLQWAREQLDALEAPHQQAQAALSAGQTLLF